MMVYFCKTCKNSFESTHIDKRYCPYCMSESIVPDDVKYEEREIR